MKSVSRKKAGKATTLAKCWQSKARRFAEAQVEDKARAYARRVHAAVVDEAVEWLKQQERFQRVIESMARNLVKHYVSDGEDLRCLDDLLVGNLLVLWDNPEIAEEEIARAIHEVIGHDFCSPDGAEAAIGGRD